MHDGKTRLPPPTVGGDLDLDDAERLADAVAGLGRCGRDHLHRLTRSSLLWRNPRGVSGENGL
jgi:hypothetical protein